MYALNGHNEEESRLQRYKALNIFSHKCPKMASALIYRSTNKYRVI